MSRTLKRLEIGNYEWAIPSESGITVIYKYIVDNPSYPKDDSSELPYLVGMGYDSTGLPVFYDENIDDPGYANDKYVYDGTFTLNGVTYDKWKLFTIVAGGGSSAWPWSDDVQSVFDNNYRLTNKVISDIHQVQVESSICDGAGNNIANTYVRRDSLSSTSFPISGNYADLTNGRLVYRIRVEVEAEFKGSTVTFVGDFVSSYAWNQYRDDSWLNIYPQVDNTPFYFTDPDTEIDLCGILQVNSYQSNPYYITIIYYDPSSSMQQTVVYDTQVTTVSVSSTQLSIGYYTN